MTRLGVALLTGAAIAGVAPRAWADPPALRWSRPILASDGWDRVDLPDDVLAACRPGVPDLRVRGADGTEVPYVLEQSLGAGMRDTWPARDVESTPGRETTAIVDRGAHPKPEASATIEVDAPEFLKPVVIESSDDAHDWKEIARGSIFATAAPGRGARMTTLRFAPNDRRYWRLRLDDRNSDPLRPLAVSSDPFTPSAPPARTLTLGLTRSPTDGGESLYEATLPAANLSIASLELAPTDAVFSRRATIFERVLLRDEIRRRTLGSATIARGPGGESLSVLLGALRGPSLEILVEDGASPPLTIPRATVTVAPQSILFFVLGGSLPVTLEYGSAMLPAAQYDVAAALANGRPNSVKTTSLGVAVDRGAASPVGVPPHGGRVDESPWQTKAAIDLPEGGSGGVAYLPLEGIDAAAGIRVVDEAAREVPFVFEQTVHRARVAVEPKVTETEARTTLRIEGLAALRQIEGLEVTAVAPEYFRRSVTVVEAVRDARGPIGERVLGAATWERQPGEAAAPVKIALAAPTQSVIEVRIENGGNAPLTLGRATIERSVRRIDFVYAKGDSLSLLAGNASSGAPAYDLSMLAGSLLALPAQAARLEPARDLAPPKAAPAPWFWVVVIAAGLGIGGMLARVMMTPKKA